MSWLAVLFFAALLALAGRMLPLRTWTLRWMAGALLLHLLLTAYDVVGLRWNRWTLLVPLLLLAALGLRRKMETERLPSDLGLGDGAALFALAAFTLFAPTLWTMTPDFVYHWGIKGEHFFLAGRVDYEWLAKPWNWVIHPDYPNLLPELFAGSAMFAGRFAAPAQMLWSALVLALILVAARRALGGTPRPMTQMGIAAVAFTLAGFGLGHRAAGGADGMPALAFLAALPALLRPADREGDVEVGIAAAFAAASKMEGMPLAAFLAGIQLLRRRDLRSALWLGLPTALVSIPWAIRTFGVFGPGLYQKYNTGAVEPGRAAVIFRSLRDATFGENWHGLPVVLLAVPLLLLVRRTRAVAAVALLQLLFYLW
ncbi:MAG TPA: hypothetical protein VH394_23390, partial [Thermoanaerobaculia bacterium]|nr:hypothetical protein [Thermoanaerobaculia bacterium]